VVNLVCAEKLISTKGQLNTIMVISLVTEHKNIKVLRHNTSQVFDYVVAEVVSCHQHRHYYYKPTVVNNHTFRWEYCLVGEKRLQRTSG